ncbi:alpha-ketoglutarate-dependent dioxygenase AlkB [soil metagenome]
MDLFNPDSRTNILPSGGTAIYYGRIFNLEIANFYLDELLNTIPWKNDEALVFGKLIITKRKVAWYGDSAFSYTYSNITRQALVWTNELLALKKITEEITGSTFNSCLLNLYHSGDEGVTWHSDDEKTLLKNGTIASISFGAERKFSFKHKHTGTSTSVLLEHGSLLEMKDEIQSNWLHSLPKSKKITTPRINLTFRTILR